MRTGPSDTLIAHKAISLADDLSGTEKRVAAAIIDHFNRKTGQCDPSLGSLAKLLGISRRTVIRSVGSLVSKGYFLKVRHGGKSHRNSYLPVWSRFHTKEAKWKDARGISGKPRVTPSSPLQGRSCHLASDVGGTQTFLSNSSKEPSSASDSNGSATGRKRNAQKASCTVSNSKGSQLSVDARFHVKLTSPSDAAFGAAQRRWMTALTMRYAPTPEAFAVILDSIDEALSDAATRIEMKKPGAGLQHVLDVLSAQRSLLPKA